MVEAAVEVLGLILAILGWCLESSSTNSDKWKIKSHSDSVTTSSSLYEGLWTTCAANSMGAVQCQRYKTILGLPVTMSMAVEILGFLMCIGGWLLTGVSLANDFWRVTSFAGGVITSTRQYMNLWHACAEASTGIKNCRRFESMLALDGYVQACRALMIIALLFGLFSMVLSVLGLKCTKLGSMSDQGKGRLTLTAGIMFILSGVCVLIAVSWYAARIVKEFNDPFYLGTRFELGAGLYLGWAAAVLVILGGGMLCGSFSRASSRSNTGAYSYNYSGQGQKIYKAAPTAGSGSSKAYV